MATEVPELDAYDARILAALQRDARISMAELGRQVHLSQPQSQPHGSKELAESDGIHRPSVHRAAHLTVASLRPPAMRMSSERSAEERRLSRGRAAREPQESCG